MATKMKSVTFHIDRKIDDMLYEMRKIDEFTRCSKSEIIRSLILRGLEVAERERLAGVKPQ